MHDGTWTIERCDYAEVRALARGARDQRDDGVVLVRRGYARPRAAARAFLDGERAPHDPFLLGDMAAAVERIRAAIAAGKRICVHGDYDVDGICATALAVLTLRELGADVEWHLPSRFDEGYGVSRRRSTRLAEEGCGLVLTVDCGITAVEEVAEAKALGLDVSSPTTTGRARRCPTARSSPRGRPTTRSRSSAAPASSTSSRRRCSASSSGCSPPPRPRRARDDRRRRPAGRREPLARDRRPARARADAAAGPARADAQRRASIPPPSTPAPSASGSRRGSTRPAASAVPTPRSSCSSPRTRRRRRGSPTSSRR